MRSWIAMTGGVLLTLAAAAATLPYDEKADASAMLQQSLQQAQAQGKKVLVIFGANWCEDCRELDKALHRSTSNLVESQFVIVRINVGNFDRNLNLAERYGNPIKSGIPAAVVLTPDNKVLYSTKAGELANARHMSDQSIFQFFTKVIGDIQQHGV